MHRHIINESELADIFEKVDSGEELSLKDGVRLLEDGNLFELGCLASSLKLKTSGRIVTFVVNLHVNYTNICVSQCPLCAFFREKKDDDAFTLSVEEILAKISEWYNRGIKEVHIVGGLNPELGIEYFEHLFSEIKFRYPGVSIKALTAVEIDFLSKMGKMSVREVLERLRDSGMEFMPGGGAEIFSERVRNTICPSKISGKRWLKIIETAHKAGIRTNATILYGHIEKPEERIEHLIKLRELQKKTGGFQALVPLSFHPKNTGLYHGGLVTEKVSPEEDMKMMAISRIMLGEWIPNIRAHWVMLGERVSQISLHFGVNDLEGTVGEEKITHAAGAKTKQYMEKERLIHLIREAGMIPAERTTDYNILKVYQ